MSTASVLLLDSNVWSHLVLGLPEKQASVSTALGALLQQYPGTVLATSQICIAECLVGARRLPDPLQRQAAEAELQREFGEPDLAVVEVTPRVLNRAATIRAESLLRVAASGHAPPGTDGGKLKLPDAIIAASCFDFDPPAILVTENDSDFRYVEVGIQKTVAGLVVESVG